MRKTPYAMVGLLALGLWALPALAADIDLPLAQEPIPLENRAGRIGAVARGDEAAYRATLSGSLIKQTQATTTWYLYPGACNQRAAGTWAPYTLGPVADSLNSYDLNLQNDGYSRVDNSLNERLWHIDDGTTVDRATGNEPWPLPIDGSRSLWCGKTDPTFVVKSGYPNSSCQILYFDTDLVAAGGGASRVNPYTLSWSQYLSSELYLDRLYVIGGAGGKDPIGNSRALLANVITFGSDGNGNELLISFTGSQVANQTLAYTPGGIIVNGTSGKTGPTTVTVSLSNIPANHRAIYFVFVTDNVRSPDPPHGSWESGSRDTPHDTWHREGS